MAARSGMSATNRRAYRNGPVLGKIGLDRLMPMHLWVGPTGHILRVGPTLQKLCPGMAIVGRRMTEFLEIRRPRGIQLMPDLLARDGAAAQVLLRHDPQVSLKGLIIALPRDQGAILNLAPGISVTELVQKFDLKNKDFAPNDPTVEMLYLIEAQTAILEESKSLNNRLQVARVAAEEQAFTDTLTGLKNRRALDHLLARVTDGGEGRKFGLMHVDLDYFKSVNDTHGHAAGDHVLQTAARIFVQETRAEDIVARTGGDEFVLVLMNCDNTATLNRIAARIIERLEQPIRFGGATCRISASIGTTVSSLYRNPDAAQLCNDADIALYQSKDRGRACFTLFSPD